MMNMDAGSAAAQVKPAAQKTASSGVLVLPTLVVVMKTYEQYP
jgi:hypothetical protein